MSWNRVRSFAQTAQFGSSSQQSTAVAVGGSVAVGDLLMVAACCARDLSGVGTTTMVDTLGNTYHQITTAQGGTLYDATNSEGVDAWWCVVAFAGTPTITYTPLPGSNTGWMALKGSHFTGGTATAGRRDSKGAAQTNPGTGTNAITTASVGAANGDLLWVGGGNPGSQTGTTLAIGSAFSAGGGLDTTSNLIDEYLTATGAAAGTMTDATNGSANIYMTIAIAINPAADTGTEAGFSRLVAIRGAP